MTKKILLVEDETLIALDIEFAITDANCDVIGTAQTVDEGLSMLNSMPCDGVVLDANLGGHSVQPIIKHLQAKALPYIVVSGYTRDQLEFLPEEAVLIGKPFSMTELVDAIRRHLG